MTSASPELKVNWKDKNENEKSFEIEKTIKPFSDKGENKSKSSKIISFLIEPL